MKTKKIMKSKTSAICLCRVTGSGKDRVLEQRFSTILRLDPNTRIAEVELFGKPTMISLDDLIVDHGDGTIDQGKTRVLETAKLLAERTCQLELESVDSLQSQLCDANKLHAQVRGLIDAHDSETTTDSKSFDRLGRKIIGADFECKSLNQLESKITRTINGLNRRIVIAKRISR